MDKSCFSPKKGFRKHAKRIKRKLFGVSKIQRDFEFLLILVQKLIENYETKSLDEKLPHDSFVLSSLIILFLFAKQCRTHYGNSLRSSRLTSTPKTIEGENGGGLRN